MFSGDKRIIKNYVVIVMTIYHTVLLFITIVKQVSVNHFGNLQSHAEKQSHYYMHAIINSLKWKTTK